MKTNNLSKLNFKIIDVSSIDEDNNINFKERLEKLLQNKGYPWTSERFCVYPQEIIVQFDSAVNLYQINLLSHDKKIPRRISFYSFCPNDLDRNYKYTDVNFKYVGYVNMKDNIDCNYKVREFKQIFVNIQNVLFLKIELENNFVNNYNKFQQIEILNVQFLGGKKQNYNSNDNINLNSSIKDKEKENKLNLNVETIIRDIIGNIYDLLLKKVINNDKKDNKEYSTIKNKLEEMNSIGKKIYQIKLLEKNASKNDDFDKAIELKNKSDKLKNQIKELAIQASNYIDNTNDNNDDHLTSGGEINEIKIKENKSYVLKNNENEGENKANQKKPLLSISELDLKDSNDFDDTIVPTVNKKMTKNKSNLYDTNKEQYKQILLPLEDLDEDNLKDYKLLINYLKENGLRMLLSNQIGYKIKGFQILTNELNNIFSDEQINDLLYELIGLESKFLDDKNNSALIKSFQLIKETFSQIIASDIDIKSNKKLLNYINDRIIQKIIPFLGDGEVKIRKGASELFLYILNQNILNYNSMITNLLNNDINDNVYNSFNGSQNLKIYSKLNIIKKILENYDNILEYKYSTKESFPKDVILDYIFININNKKLEIKSIIRELISLATKIFGLQDIKNKLEFYLDNDNEIMKLASQISELKPLVNAGISKSQSQINIFKSSPVKKKLKKNASQVNIKNIRKIHIQKDGNRCQLCYESLGNMKLSEHIKKCLMYSICDSCGENIKVEKLNHHKLNTCKNKKNYKQCPKCKEAIKLSIFNLHNKKNICNHAKINMYRCPLCHHDIEKSENGFYQHLMLDGCAYQINNKNANNI